MALMSTRRRGGVFALVLLALATTHGGSLSPGQITTPRQFFGFDIGDDYALANHTQLEAYWHTLDRESDRMVVVDIGRTAEGRTQWMAVVSSPENMVRLERYKAIARRLARAEGVTDAEARALASEGRAIVWIDGGLHADEVLGAQQLIEAVYQFVSRDDDETRRILDNVILLAADVNPDGHELVANWYMREPKPSSRTLAGVPRLYQKYAGHDNNRDFYMSTQPETRNINRVLFDEWLPQVVLDHHQPGPVGTVMFAPPFRGLFNDLFDPLIPVSVDRFGRALHSRFAAEGKAGVTMRSGSNYSTWWNGGLRTTAYFHNQIGLLTETIGGPTPTRIPFVAATQQASADLPFPIGPQEWHFRRSIEYALTANRAVLDEAARNRVMLLLNIYHMGRNAIERGSADSWTPAPHRRVRVGDPSSRDPRGYILPANQPDFPTATRFVQALMGSGVRVMRATASFSVAGVVYPSGSYVVKTAQAFRPHVLDMFEPQDPPDDVPEPGGPPLRPYDNAGWTLAYQMGVRAVRVLDGFDGPFEPLEHLPLVAPAPMVEQPGTTRFVFSRASNNAFAVVNRLLAAGAQVYQTRTPAMTYVPATSLTRALLRSAAAELGVSVTGEREVPPSAATEVRPVRVGLWDQYGGSVESGWIRFVLEQFELPFERVYAQALDAGDLATYFDVLIFPHGAIPGLDGAPRYSDDAPPDATLPQEYRPQTGVVSVARTVPQLKAFVDAGGTLIAMGSSTAIAQHLRLPLRDALVARGAGGNVEPLTAERYFVPGSVLRVALDTRSPLTGGMGRVADIMFDNSPVFRLEGDARSRGVTPVAWFEDTRPLRSGWALGQEHLRGGVAVVDARVGRGRVVLFGPPVVFRGQSYGTFKLLFNAIHLGRATEVLRVP